MLRSDGTKNVGMMSQDAFATEALALLDEDRDEVLVGLSIGTRRHGEALFERMNGGWARVHVPDHSALVQKVVAPGIAMA